MSFPAAVSSRAAPVRQGYTLVEMLVVISIIVALMGISMGVAYALIGPQAQARWARVTCRGIATAMQAYESRYGLRVITVNINGTDQLRPIWNLDGPDLAGNPLRYAIDGDPALGQAFDLAGFQAPGWYRGAARMLSDVPSESIDRKTGRLIDRWKRPLRIHHHPDLGILVWSVGPDGIDQTQGVPKSPDANDDIGTWSGAGSGP